jgi:VanZ family protein
MKKETRKKWRTALRILLPIVCVALLAFIFGNSLQSGVQSTKQSESMTGAVQTVAGWVAPNSAIATATGAAYERLHKWVRIFAHFIEFGALGAALVWCAFSYSLKKRWLFIPAGLILLVPIVDENLQRFAQDRAFELFDIAVNTFGGVCGGVFAVIVTGLILLGLKKSAQKEKKKGKE